VAQAQLFRIAAESERGNPGRGSLTSELPRIEYFKLFVATLLGRQSLSYLHIDCRGHSMSTFGSRWLVATAIVLCLTCGALNVAAKTTTETAASTKLDRALASIAERLDAWPGEREVLYTAARELDEILARHPESAPAHRELARYLIFRSKRADDEAKVLGEAEASLDRAVALAPDFADAHVLRGHLYRLQGRSDEANDSLIRAQKIGTRDPWLELNWADLLRDEGKFDEAIKRCRRALSRKTINAKARYAGEYCLISSYAALRRWDDAEAVYRERVECDPRRGAPNAQYAQFQLCKLLRPAGAANLMSGRTARVHQDAYRPRPVPKRRAQDDIFVEVLA
jgi:pentatricopeptide repeat protein